MQSCRTRRARPAPSATRIASSRSRDVARASSRLGEVHGGDDEHESHRAEEHEQGGSHLSDDRVAQRSDRRRSEVSIILVLGGESARDRVHLRVRLPDGDAGLHPRDDVHDSHRANARNRLIRDRRIRDVHLDRGRRKAEAGRHHADDLVRLAAERDAPPDDGCRSAELALPEIVAEHDQLVVRAAHHLFVARNAADFRRDAERVPEPRRDERGGDALRLADAGEVGAAHPLDVEVAADVGEHSTPRAPVIEVHRGDRSGIGCSLHDLDLPHADELLGIRKGERFEQDAVDDAEDRAVRADPQRERQNRDERERRILGERAQREPSVVSQFAEPFLDAGSW